MSEQAATKKTKTREERRAEAIQVVKEQAVQQSLYFFHDAMRRAFATVPKDGHRETWPIRSRDFRLWVTNVLYDSFGAAPKALVAAVLEEFEVHAICKGATHETHVRIAEQSGATFIDLGNAQWQALKISRDGWRIIDEAPVKFLRPAGITGLPYPRSGGRLRDVTRFLNISPKSEVLLLTWLTYAWQGSAPFPILALSGVQGSGKSTTTRVLRELIDPSIAALTTAPRSERDLAIAANNSHLICLDNLSDISESLSDAMCRLATGGAFRTRELYTNDSEIILTYRRPLIVNGISELVGRPDLLDRAIIICVEAIPEEKRLDEKSFWKDFKNVQPQLLGAMLDVIRDGIGKVDSVLLSSAPRMADFARWGCAVEKALGFGDGAFMEAYTANRQDAHDAAVECSPIAVALDEFLAYPLEGFGVVQGRFQGTALELLANLRRFCDHYWEPNVRAASSTRLRELLRHPKFPKSASALSAEIARIEPNLKKLAITVERGRNHEGRYLVLQRTEASKLRRKVHVVEAAA